MKNRNNVAHLNKISLFCIMICCFVLLFAACSKEDTKETSDKQNNAEQSGEGKEKETEKTETPENSEKEEPDTSITSMPTATPIEIPDSEIIEEEIAESIDEDLAEEIRSAVENAMAAWLDVYDADFYEMDQVTLYFPDGGRIASASDIPWLSEALEEVFGDKIVDFTSKAYDGKILVVNVVSNGNGSWIKSNAAIKAESDLISEGADLYLAEEIRRNVEIAIFGELDVYDAIIDAAGQSNKVILLFPDGARIASASDIPELNEALGNVFGDRTVDFTSKAYDGETLTVTIIINGNGTVGTVRVSIGERVW